jgi:hypothetical protein
MTSYCNSNNECEYDTKGEDGKVVLKPVVELVDDLTFTYNGETIILN